MEPGNLGMRKEKEDNRLTEFRSIISNYFFKILQLCFRPIIQLSVFIYSVHPESLTVEDSS